MTTQKLSNFFMGCFALLWILGPLTQLLFLVNPTLHLKLGLSEHITLEPEFGWFRADETAIAAADQTYLFTGLVFMIASAQRKTWCIPLGFYTCAAWSFILLVAIFRWPLLEAAGFGVLGNGQVAFYYIYALAYVLFGWYGMFYLWNNRRIYDSYEQIRS